MPRALQRQSDIRESTLRRLWVGFALALLLTLVAEILFPAEAYFGWDGLPFFHAGLGFGACMLLVGAAHLLCLFFGTSNRGDDA